MKTKKVKLIKSILTINLILKLKNSKDFLDIALKSILKNLIFQLIKKLIKKIIVAQI